MTGSRHELRAAMAACLAGAAASLVAAGRPWVEIAVRRAAPGPGTPDGFHVVHSEFSGRTLAPTLTAWSLLALAAVVAIPASRRIGRLVTGALVFAAGAIVAGLALQVRADPVDFVTTVTDPSAFAGGRVTVTGATWVAVAAGVLLAATGAVVAWRGPRWPALSRRYSRSEPAEAEPAGDEADLWDRLDADADREPRAE